MRRSRSSRISHSILIAGLVADLLVAILAVPLFAQPAPGTRPAQGFGPVYDSAHEITLNGTIQTIVTAHVKGSPAGMHLLVTGPEGNVVDAHLGPFLNKATREALQEGTPVRIVGAMTILHGKSYLYARLLTVNDRTITVRSTHGVLSPMPSARRAPPRTETKSVAEANGGAQ